MTVHSIEGTDITWTAKSYTGYELLAYEQSPDHETMSENVGDVLELMVDTVFIDGKPVADALMNYSWEDVVMPVFWSAKEALIPKAPSGTSTETG